MIATHEHTCDVCNTKAVCSLDTCTAPRLRTCLDCATLVELRPLDSIALETQRQAQVLVEKENLVLSIPQVVPQPAPEPIAFKSAPIEGSAMALLSERLSHMLRDDSLQTMSQVYENAEWTVKYIWPLLPAGKRDLLITWLTLAARVTKEMTLNSEVVALRKSVAEEERRREVKRAPSKAQSLSEILGSLGVEL